MSGTVPATLRDVGRIYPPAGAVFPHELVQGCADALVMFAAGFYGVQDAYWLSKAGVKATCIDIDPEKLAVMEAVYPPGWRFVNGDAFDYLASCDETFDVLTADAPTAMSDRCIGELALLLSVTERVCIISVHTEMDRWDEVTRGLEIPRPWKQTGLIFRTTNYGGCYWLTIERQR